MRRILLLFLVVGAIGCEESLDIPLPSNTLYVENAYANDKAVSAVLNGIYAETSRGGVFDGASSIGFLTALYADELTDHSTSPVNGMYYRNGLGPNGTVPNQWTALYRLIYSTNLAIEGIDANVERLNMEDLWMGEAYFLRAYFHYYLTQLYGDIPIATTSDYLENNSTSRRPQIEVYQQILTDLLMAQTLLPEDYHGQNGFEAPSKRTRPNKSTATALLAKVYLSIGDWDNAAREATKVIDQPLYDLVSLDQVFLANSGSTIWNLPKTTTPVADYTIYVMGLLGVMGTGTFPNDTALGYLSNSLTESFDMGDQRLATWTVSLEANARTYYVPAKYQSPQFGVENIVLFRLAEQYMIRAEARAMLNDLPGAQSDLNRVRARAGLENVTVTGQAQAIALVQEERRHEFFAEMGHRFFDLKRLGTIDEVMAVEGPLKIDGGSQWQSFMANWPISADETRQNPNLEQTEGY